jgi:PPE-repeat protein
MLDYAALPPEVNSARMYAGPGSAAMMAAASAWDGLAAELSSAATAYGSVVSRLAGEEWLGPASASMAAAVAPYVAWMNTTATQAEQTASQAKAGAAAFETAFAATVPPPVVAANRSLLMSLIATNVLGQNTPAIAATEAHYGQMWAQDAAAMYGYAGSSAAAAQVTPFTAPQQNTNPAGQAAQSAAVAQSTGSSAGSGVQQALSQVVSTTPNVLHGLASPMSSASSLGSNPFAPGSDTAGDGLAGLLNLLDGQDGSALGTFLDSGTLNGFTSAGYVSPAFISPAATSGIADIAVLSQIGKAGAFGLGGGLGIPALSGASLASAAGSSSPTVLAGSVMSAGVDRATLVGALSVPQSWSDATPAASPAPAATASLVSSWTAAPDVGAGGMSGMPGMPGMPMAGSAAGRGYGFAAPRYGFKPTVMARPVLAG